MSDLSYDVPASFDGTVRLFPLSDLVMFPSNVLPLHILESRYREMLEDAMQGDQLIAMATLVPGFEHDYYSRPPIAPVVCIGRVTAYEKTDQGTYDLLLQGLRRAAIAHEIEPVRSFRRANVQLIGNGSSEEHTAVTRVGERLGERILQTLPAARELVEGFIQRRIPLASLVDIVAFHLPLTTELKLQLLGEPDLAVRAKLLLASLPPVKASRPRTRPYPTDFSDN